MSKPTSLKDSERLGLLTIAIATERSRFTSLAIFLRKFKISRSAFLKSASDKVGSILDHYFRPLLC